MIIPDKVKIGGINYDVVTTDKNLIIGNKANHTGVIHYDESLIELSSTLKGNAKEQTFLHEVLHGIAFDRGIDLKEDEETIIDQFASGLLGFIKDNPDIFKEVES